MIIIKGFVFIKSNLGLLKKAEKIVGTILTNKNIANVKDEIESSLGKYFFHFTGKDPLIITIINIV